MLGFGRLAEPHLVGNDNAEPRRGNIARRAFPVGATEILAVEERYRASIRLQRENLHVSHAKRLPLARECMPGHRKRIRIALQIDTQRFNRLGSMLSCRKGSCREGE
jgi:hypothetical protein